MEPIKIATAQFENRSNDKTYNLSVIRKFAMQAKMQGAQVIAFHECSVTGYSFARHLNREELTAIAELIPEGESIQELIAIARELDMYILAGLFEKTTDGTLYKAYVCVGKNGLVA